MDDMTSLVARLRQDASLPATLTASFDTFEAIRRLARVCQNAGPDLFAAFMTTAAAAADGRDAITTAPSLPPGSASLPDMLSRLETEPVGAADAIAALAATLAARLDDAADQATTPADRAACGAAAQAASEIHQLMTRGDLP